MGRKSTYNNDILERVKMWARDGLTEKEMCAKIGITEQCFAIWKHKYIELVVALKENKEIVDAKVEQALYKKAMGFEYEETKITVDENGKKRVEKIKRFCPPSDTAMIFWLKNRQRTKWRNREEVEISDSGNLTELINVVKGFMDK